LFHWIFSLLDLCVPLSEAHDAQPHDHQDDLCYAFSFHIYLI
jgi:hypothetical protein